ncbi:Hypothetical protein PHPALM_37702 [Phytophthora palmivora]|uniref:Uncharacterized protein n=1 Tax=Phytophthora palmivora TaxID=4796 RepID=A0A2P4WWR8_9STRA|nr:Hypothetical protein PHPALM_37702 [Phytophthora palmivora]
MSILSALVEESPINAYMMNEKTAVVHATQDRLVRLASNLVHAIESSKHSVNIAAYQAEKVAKARKQSASYTDMLVAALTTNPRQKPSSAPSRNDVARRFLTSSASSTNNNGLTENKPNVGCYGDRQRQAFKLEVAPPALSAHYRLLFSQKLKKPEVLPLPDESESNNPMTMHDQPPSSLPRKVLPLHLTPRSLTAAIYSGGSIFVEPSPLPKRLLYRGSYSAGGIRRKLSLPKKIQRVQTERLPPTQPLTSLNSDQPQEAEINPVKYLSDHVNEDTPAVRFTDENDSSMEDRDLEESEHEQKEKEEGEKEIEGEDESYEDDFDTTGDDLEGDEKMLSRIDSSQLASDGELIDLLHARSDSLPHILSTPVEVNAATTIQRYVRGVLVRRKYAQPSRTSIKSAMQANGKTPQTTNSSRCGRRESRHGRTKEKCIPLSARSYRQLRSEGSNRRDNARSRVRPVMKMSSTPGKQARTKSKVSGQASVNSNVQTLKPNNQLLSPSRSPQQRGFPLPNQELTATTDNEPHKEEVNTKGPPNPKALKQVQTLYAEGLKHHKKNHLGLAIECYEKALIIPGAQNFASIHVNLGSALMAQNKFSEALESFEHAKRIQPNNVKAIYNFSLALLHLDRAHEAQRLVRL